MAYRKKNRVVSLENGIVLLDISTASNPVVFMEIDAINHEKIKTEYGRKVYAVKFNSGKIYAYVMKGKQPVSVSSIVACPADGQVVDHINGQTLDNRAENLRCCTSQQNSMNSKTRKNNTSGFRGVSFMKRKKKWRAYIMLNRKQISLGLFNDPRSAFVKRVEAEKKYFGEYAPV